MSRLGQALLKTLAVTVALLFLLGAIVTAMPALFGGSKVRTLFAESERALGGVAVVDAGPTAAPTQQAPEVEPARMYMPATKAGPMPVPRPKPSDAPDAGTRSTLFGKPQLPDGGEPVFFPASKSLGGMNGTFGGLGSQQQAPR